jgi:D-alanyl-D-alanine carboxypeptidase
VSAGTVRGLVAVCIMGTIALLTACGAAAADKSSGGLAGSPSESTAPETMPSHPSPSPSSTPLPARFMGAVSALPADLEAQMRGTTWHPGCPVAIGRLRLLTLRYWGFDRQVHEGRMVVNTSVAAAVVSAFRQMFEARFPIDQMHLAVKYRPNHDDPNDDRDYTAGFNCRPVVTARGAGTTWSQHAYGLAIDINPIENPYVTADGYVRNNNARPFRDRSLHEPGMIHAGDTVVQAFASIGWQWGGYWSGDKDYMHFSLTGR